MEWTTESHTVVGIFTFTFASVNVLSFTQPLCDGCCGFFLRDKASETHVHLISWSKVHVALPPRPHTPSRIVTMHTTLILTTFWTWCHGVRNGTCKDICEVVTALWCVLPNWICLLLVYPYYPVVNTRFVRKLFECVWPINACSTLGRADGGVTCSNRTWGMYIWGSCRKEWAHLSYSETKVFIQKQAMSIKSRHILLLLYKISMHFCQRCRILKLPLR